MKISDKTLLFLKDIITGDSKISPYKSGPELVDFFNNLGFFDTYGAGFPSRWAYVQERLKILNKENIIDKVIKLYFSPINFLDNEIMFEILLEKFNKYLFFDDYKIKIVGKEVKIISLKEKINLISQDKILNLNNSVIQENIQKCDEKINFEDYSGAITNARSFLESILIFLYEKTEKKELGYDGNLPKLFKLVINLMNLDINSFKNENYKRISGGFISIISSIAEISNKFADRHGRVKDYKKSIKRRLAVLVVNSVKVISLYFLDLFEDKFKNDLTVK